MTTGEAKEIARTWVYNEGAKLPGFRGAFFHGSVNYLADDAPQPATSDLDVMVVLEGPEPPQKLGKFRYRDVLLEVSYLPDERLQSAEQVLADYPIAPSFSVPSVILDPDGRLTTLQAAVSREFARLPCVCRRCEQACEVVLSRARGVREGDPLHDQVTTWLFSAGVTTHVLLIAGLKNATVRRRYETVRELLTEYGRLDFHEELLELLGCASMTPERAAQHLDACAAAFDTAGSVLKTPYRFAADLMPDARPVAIDGSRDLIERGLHREAVFWIAATYSRCQSVLSQDAPAAVQQQHTAGYCRLLEDLGVAAYRELQRRCRQIEAALPRVRNVADRIIAANPGIQP